MLICLMPLTCNLNQQILHLPWHILTYNYGSAIGVFPDVIVIMLFRSIAFLISSLLFTQAAVGHSASIPDGVVSNINTIASISRNLNSALSGLTTASSNPDVVTMGEVIPLYWLTGLLLTRYPVQKVKTDFKNIVYDLDANTNAL